VNIELFKKVKIQVDTEEASLDMANWEAQGDPVCGTTRCLAGWAVNLTTGAPLYTWRKREGWSEIVDLSPETTALADAHELNHDIPQIAGHLLGLTAHEENVFYMDEGAVFEFIDLVASGHVATARAFLRTALDDAGF